MIKFFFIFIGFFLLTGIVLSELFFSGNFAWIIMIFLYFTALFFLSWSGRIFFIILFANVISSAGTLILWQAVFLLGCGLLTADIISHILFNRHHAPISDAVSVTLAVAASFFALYAVSYATSAGIIGTVLSSGILFNEILAILGLGTALFFVLTIASNHSKYGSVI